MNLGDDNPYRSPLTPGESLDGRRDYRMTPAARLANTIVGGLVIALGLGIIFLGIVATIQSRPEGRIEALMLLAIAMVPAAAGAYIIYWARSHPTTAESETDRERNHIIS
jgi:hypothetical protein